jgi:hypothetical protein
LGLKLVPAEPLQFFNQGFFHGSVDMPVRIVGRGVIPFVLHKGVFEGCSCGFMLVHEPFGFFVVHSYVVHSDAAVFGVVFDNHIYLSFFGYYRSNKSRFTISAEEFNKIFPILSFFSGLNRWILGFRMLTLARSGKLAGRSQDKSQSSGFLDKKGLDHFFGANSLFGIGQQAILNAVLHFIEFDD